MQRYSDPFIVFYWSIESQLDDIDCGCVSEIDDSSTVSEEFEVLSDEDLGTNYDVPDDVLDCFMNCDVRSTTSTHMANIDDSYSDGFKCDVCGIESENCNLCFYHCPKHYYDTCSSCENRRENFK